MIAAPFCVLTVLPLLALPLLSGPLLTRFLFFTFLQTALRVGDAATFLRLLRQTTSGTRIHNQGWQTYWSTMVSA
jgi:hypothetical protein